MSDSDLFEMHKIHMLNMLKYTESIKEMTELVDFEAEMYGDK